MENLIYTRQQIESLLNILNNMHVVGIDNCNKITAMYQILESGIKNEGKVEVENNNK